MPFISEPPQQTKSTETKMVKNLTPILLSLREIHRPKQISPHLNKNKKTGISDFHI